MASALFSYTLPSSQPRIAAIELSESTGKGLMLSEIIAWLPSATLNAFLADFASHLEQGDFDDLLTD
jgi:hypothetical protein